MYKKFSQVQLLKPGYIFIYKIMIYYEKNLQILEIIKEIRLDLKIYNKFFIKKNNYTN